MQTVLIVLVSLALFVGILFLSGGSELGSIFQPSQPAVVSTPAPTETANTPASSTVGPTESVPTGRGLVTLSIDRRVSWDSSPVDIPVMMQGTPSRISFVIDYPANIARVITVDTSADWDVWVDRDNVKGQVTVNARQLAATPGTFRLLTLRVYRLARGTADFTIPADQVQVEANDGTRYRVIVRSGLVTAPRE